MSKSSPRPTPKATRASRVSAALKLAILTGDLAPGSKVNLDRLRAEYGVSLSPMREAVSRLVADWLVVSEDQRGYRIAPVSPENLAEVTRLRADLAGLALGHAVLRADLEWESAVMADLHRMVQAAPADRPAAHARFHATLVAGCGMPMLQETCARLDDLHRRYRTILGCPPASDDTEAHTAIAEAAVAREADRAIALLSQHIEAAGARLDARLGGFG